MRKGKEGNINGGKEKIEGKGNILIVEDDEDICRSLELIFKKYGYQIETAATGQEALNWAEESYFNLALLDINLPDTQGVKLIAPLKQLHRETEVIIATGYASTETAVQAKMRGPLPI